MTYTQIPKSPNITGQPITIWASPTLAKWLATQGDPAEVAADLLADAHRRATTPRERITRVWHNPDYAHPATPIPPSPTPPPKLPPPPAPAAAPPPPPAADHGDSSAKEANGVIMRSPHKPQWTYLQKGAAWVCTLKLGSGQWSGTGPSKKQAKQSCCASFLETQEKAA